MTQDDLLNAILDAFKHNAGVESASRIDGEPVIGVETADGTEYFITVESA